MKTVGRISVVAICYLLSSYGIFLSLMLIGMSGIKSLSCALVGLLILLAWVCHLIMSINWVIDKPAKKWVLGYGTFAGVLGLLFWPLAHPTIKNFDITDICRAAAMGVVFTLPCFLLAIYLVRFHLREQSIRESAYVS